MPLSPEQQRLLLQPLDPGRVRTIRRGRQELAHLEAWDVRRWLIRVFGHTGFSITTLSLEMISETPPPQGWTVIYRAQVRLEVPGCHLDDAAAGDATRQPSRADAHDLAMKTALSQALKRCAVNLGDLYGLSLYDGGSTAPVVGWTAVTGDAPDQLQPEVVHPDPESAALDGPATRDDLEKIRLLGTRMGLDTPQSLRATISEMLGRDIRSSRDLTATEATMIIERLEALTSIDAHLEGDDD